MQLEMFDADLATYHVPSQPPMMTIVEVKATAQCPYTGISD